MNLIFYRNELAHALENLKSYKLDPDNTYFRDVIATDVTQLKIAVFGPAG